MFGYNNRVVLSCVSFISWEEKDQIRERERQTFLPVSLHLLPSALMFLPPSFCIIILPSSGPAPEEPQGSCWIGLGSENRRQLPCDYACRALVWVPVCVPLHRVLAPYVGPHLLLGRGLSIQALIKSGFVYPPACKQKQFVSTQRHAQVTGDSHRKHTEDVCNYFVFKDINLTDYVLPFWALRPGVNMWLWDFPLWLCITLAKNDEDLTVLNIK